MEIRDTLWEPDLPIEAVYFPRTCVLSILVPLSDTLPIEAATVGREGFAGLPVLLGVDSTSTLAIAQVAGDAVRIRAKIFREIVLHDERMLTLFLRHAESLHEQTAQSVACNSRHSVEQRCARWLLMTHDRVDGAHFYLTQQFLAAMLGVRRATVTDAAGTLQQAGLIRYARGHVSVLDREGLESVSCECYGVVRSRLEKLLN
jgi:CRP-like cAMP-binding protein